jgi:hypothetical protein
VTRKVFLILLALVLALSVGLVGCAASPSGEQEEEEDEEWDLCVDFEDLPLAEEYHVGEAFTSCGFVIHVEEFQWTPPPHEEWTDTGYASVQDGEDAGGSGQDMFVNNVNLYFRRPPDLLEGLSLLYGEYGGNINVQVNDEFVNVDDFEDLPASMGGVDVTVSDFGSGKGRLTLSKGKIGSFKIGGQELFIDDVCLTFAS